MQPDPAPAPQPQIGALVQEARRLAEDALEMEAGHSEEARTWSLRHKWIGIAAAILAALSGVLAGAGTSDKYGIWPGLAASILAFSVAALS
jgi:hypothetical protein